MQALQRCKLALGKVQVLLCNSGYVGKPFAQGVKDILGEQAIVQIAKRSELHNAPALGGEAQLCVAGEAQVVVEALREAAQYQFAAPFTWHSWLCCF